MSVSVGRTLCRSVGHFVGRSPPWDARRRRRRRRRRRGRRRRRRRRRWRIARSFVRPFVRSFVRVDFCFHRFSGSVVHRFSSSVAPWFRGSAIDRVVASSRRRSIPSFLIFSSSSITRRRFLDSTIALVVVIHHNASSIHRRLIHRFRSHSLEKSNRNRTDRSFRVVTLHRHGRFATTSSVTLRSPFIRPRRKA